MRLNPWAGRIWPPVAAVGLVMLLGAVVWPATRHGVRPLAFGAALPQLAVGTPPTPLAPSTASTLSTASPSATLPPEGAGLPGLASAPLGATGAVTSPAVVSPVGLLVADSELVYGPTLYHFDTEQFVADQGGYLATYSEAYEGQELSGAAIVDQVAEEYSVGPRVLLALLEAQGGWVTATNPARQQFPLDQPVAGLGDALALTADQLNAAYYGYKYDQLRTIDLSDGAALMVPDANPGTFAVLWVTWHSATAGSWGAMEGPSRFYTAWTELFGDAYRYSVAPTVPADLVYEELALPFGPGEIWYFTAGPHSPWGVGAARAAIDLSPPPAAATGCYLAGSPVLAVAPGTVVRSAASGLVVDPNLDGDGFGGSGWVHVYVHVGAVNRAAVGTRLAGGDPIGYSSCEGGAPTQTRLTFARRYNGEWIPADYPEAPLILGGWAVLSGEESGQGFLVTTGLPPRQASPDKVDALNGVFRLSQGP